MWNDLPPMRISPSRYYIQEQVESARVMCMPAAGSLEGAYALGAMQVEVLISCRGMYVGRC